MTAKVWSLTRPGLGGDRGHRALEVPCADLPHSPLCRGDALSRMGPRVAGEQNLLGPSAGWSL